MNLNIDAIFTIEAMDNIAARLQELETSEDFFSYVDTLATDEKYLMQLPGKIELLNPLNARNDGDSAVVVFEAIGQIDRANAADPRLWSFLALVTFREYLLERWSNGSNRDWKSVVKERFFLSKPSRRKLMRHGIARLWWVANLTYDPHCERPLTSRKNDPHAYTRFVFSGQNLIQSIFERRLGSNPPVMWAIVEALGEIDAKGTQGEGNGHKLNMSDLVKKVTKEVHLRSGYRHLETLDKEELQGVVSS